MPFCTEVHDIMSAKAAWGECFGIREGCDHFALHLQFSRFDVSYLYLSNVFFLFAHQTRALYSIF